MGTSFTGEVSSDRLMSCPDGGESNLYAYRHGNRRLAPTLWPEKDKLWFHGQLDILLSFSEM